MVAGVPVHLAHTLRQHDHPTPRATLKALPTPRPRPRTGMAGSSGSLFRQSCQRKAPLAGLSARRLPTHVVPLIVVCAPTAYRVVLFQVLEEMLLILPEDGAASRTCHKGPELILARSRA